MIRKVFKLFNIEHYLMVVVALFTIFVLNQQLGIHTFKEAVVFTTFNQGVMMMFLPVVSFLGFYYWRYFSRYFIDYGVTKNTIRESLKQLSKMSGHFLWFFVPFFITATHLFFINQLIAEWTFLNPVTLKDGLLASLDYKIFGVHPFIWLPEKIGEMGAFIITYAYESLAWFLSFGFIYLYYKNFHLFRQFMMAFLLVLMFALPVYYLIPVTGAYAGYISDNILSAEINNLVIDNYNPNRITANFFDFLKHQYYQSGFLVVSSFPSMHIAWSLLLMYFLARVEKRFLYILIPWFFAESIGAIYLAQHYFVDLPAAIPFAVMGIILSAVIMKEPKASHRFT